MWRVLTCCGSWQGLISPDIRDSVRAKCRILLHANEFVMLGPINHPTDVVRSLLNMMQKIFNLVVPRALGAYLENRAPVFTWPSAWFISDSVEAKHRVLIRQARSPSLHLASALFFSVCVQGRFLISASRSARFARVRFAMLWLSLRKSTHSKEDVSKQSSTSFHASQHRISVPSCRFL